MNPRPVASRALEVNLAETRVEVEIDPAYRPIREVMEGFAGLREGLETFLKELSHPYQNRDFIISEARSFCLGYFHALTAHRQGPAAAALYVALLLDGLRSGDKPALRTNAFKTLFLFLQKLIRETGDALPRFDPVLEDAFTRMLELSDEDFFIVVTGYYALPKLVRDLDGKPVRAETRKAIFRLNHRYLTTTYSTWLSEPDPAAWLTEEIGTAPPESIGQLLRPLSHDTITGYQARLEAQDAAAPGDPTPLQTLPELPGHGEFLRIYREMPRAIGETDLEDKLRYRYKLFFLFFTMNLRGLSAIHDETLREINRIITWLVTHEDPERLEKLIDRTFGILSRNMGAFPDAVLMCVLNLGRGVYQTDDGNLANFFNRSVLQLGFQTPEFHGISSDWQIQSNIHHIQNIRTWMNVVALHPKWSQKLLSALIINLSLYGILLKDTDLFPRDITRFLSAEIRPVYNLVKQLMRLFPAYFNELGAEGALRDISTRLDELTGRRDPLIHFLRKQSHVESSSEIVTLVEGVLEFWKTRSPETLRFYLPPELYESLQSEGEHIDGVHDAFCALLNARGITDIRELLAPEHADPKEPPPPFSDAEGVDRQRVALATRLYQLLNQKYSVDSCDLQVYLRQIEPNLPAPLDRLHDALSEAVPTRQLRGLLQTLLQLKELILSSGDYEIREDIYRKRHFSVDIPSMYGSYHEPRFDAMGLTLRLEARVNALFDDLTRDLKLDFITRATFHRIHECLRLFHKALQVDGIPTREFEHQLELLDRALKIKLFSFSQYVDIFRGFARVVRNLVSDYFDDIHKANLRDMADVLEPDRLLPKYRSAEDAGAGPANFEFISEIFIRDVVASSLALQRLDLFLARVLNTLHLQARQLPQDRHYLLLTYDPSHVVTPIGQPGPAVDDIVHLGNKGHNMVRMKHLGLPVPDGFIVTTEVFRCSELIENYPPATADFRAQVDREITRLERATGRKFGSATDTLLVSVRSGAAVSQPGMMDTYLNVGMNEEVVHGLIEQTGRPWFVWDSFRRFLQFYGMSFGLARDAFDAIINEFKLRFGVEMKKEFSADQMKEVAEAYKAYLAARKIKIEWSPRTQLDIAIRKVLHSWESPKARTYRKIMGISDDWGTSVTVQAMVFGNFSEEAGSGVLFTHSPKLSPDLVRPWGDYTIGNQGEDVVSGLVSTHPISDYQARVENRSREQSLEARFPEIYRSLSDLARRLVYEEHWNPQDIEFTFEGPGAESLYILQTRDMELRERKTPATFVETPDLHRRFLGHGIGVSGGALWGRAVFSRKDIDHWRKKEPETRLILVRNDTVPDDIAEISLADGLLTARGGATSHAAIVANRLRKTCVVGCAELVCNEAEGRLQIRDARVVSGDHISIDGFEGSIYLGAIQTTEG